MNFDQPLWLGLLPLALLPLLLPAGRALPNAWAAQGPRDRASDVLQHLLRGAGVVAVAASVLSLAGPFLPEVGVERVGRGAEIVLLLDRSRSMDERYAGAQPAGGAPQGTGPEAVEYYSRLRNGGPRESKGKVARQLLGEFAAGRPQDRFAMIAFSSLPIRVLGFTNKPEIVQAAIAAGNIGRGLSETHIGLALLAGLAFFEDRAYTGSRLLLLVSDGGDRIDVDLREQVTRLARARRTAVYWIYLRAPNGPGLPLPRDGAPPAPASVTTLAPTAATGAAVATVAGFPSAAGGAVGRVGPVGPGSPGGPGATGTAGAAEVLQAPGAPSGRADAADAADAASDSVPELLLHRFFQSLGTPYRAFEAENPQALQKAIAEIGRLENLPITYVDTLPRRDLTPLCIGTALACVLVLMAAQLSEIRRWA